MEECRSIERYYNNYKRCYFRGQYGRYTVTAQMNVDDKKVTMDDWIVLIDVVQNRLIAQVEGETITGDGE